MTSKVMTMRYGLLLAIYVLSGLSGLTFEVVWVRLAALNLGTTLEAVAMVVSTFMGGLALGGWLASRVADRRELGVGTYAVLEVWIGLSGLAAVAALFHLPILGPWWVQVALASVIILLPCTLMGATVPLLAGAVCEVEKPSLIGYLYAANTLGAVVGALGADFYLIPNLGVWQTAFVAGLLNLVAGGLAWGLRSSFPPVPPRQEATASLVRLNLAYAMCGFSTLGLQVVWFRLLSTISDSQVQVFSVILALYLACLSIGSTLGSRWIRRIVDPGQALSLCLTVLSLSTLVSVWALGTVSEQGLWFSGTGPLETAALRSCVLFALPILLTGLSFPIAAQLSTGLTGGVGRPVGELYAANTTGAILGSLAAGFVLLPRLDVAGTLGMMCLCLLFAAGLVLVYARRRLLARLMLGVGSLALLAWTLQPADWLFRHINLPYYALTYGIRPQDIVHVEQDLYGCVAVATQSFAGKALFINSTMMMTSSVPGERYARLMAHLPLALMDKPRKALVICFGLGMTVGAAAREPGLDSVTCVELSPAVLRVAHYFSDVNQDVLNSKAKLVVDDGRNFLLRSQEKYDLITFEPPPPNHPKVVNLYSADYYRICRDRLSSEGMVCQWLPIGLISDESSRMIVRSMLQVFPHVTAWEGSPDVLLLVGSLRPLQIDIATMEQRLADTNLMKSLTAVGITNPADLLATFKVGHEALWRYAQNAPVISNNHPYLEYVGEVGPDPRELRERDWPALEALVANLPDSQRTRTLEKAQSLQALNTFLRVTSSLGDEVSPLAIKYLSAKEVKFPDVYTRAILKTDVEGLDTMKQRATVGGLEAKARYALNCILANSSQQEEVLSNLQREFPDSPAVYFLLALSEKEAGRHQAARNHYEQCLRRVNQPDALEVLRQLGEGALDLL